MSAELILLGGILLSFVILISYIMIDDITKNYKKRHTKNKDVDILIIDKELNNLREKKDEFISNKANEINISLINEYGEKITNEILYKLRLIYLTNGCN